MRKWTKRSCVTELTAALLTSYQTFVFESKKFFKFTLLRVLLFKLIELPKFQNQISLLTSFVNVIFTRIIRDNKISISKGKSLIFFLLSPSATPKKVCLRFFMEHNFILLVWYILLLFISLFLRFFPCSYQMWANLTSVEQLLAWKIHLAQGEWDLFDALRLYASCKNVFSHFDVL